MILKTSFLPSFILLSILITDVISFPTDSGIANTTLISGVDAVYDGCGIKKGCFGVPGGVNCIKSKNCTLMTTYRPVVNGTFFDVEIYGNTIPPDSYVAVGISTDDEMGDDSVIQCVNYKGILNAYNAVNIEGGCLRSPHLPGFKLKSASYNRGRLYCRVLQPSFYSIMNEKNRTLHFDLLNDNHYLLMASGFTGPDQIKYHHKNRCVSDGLVKEENMLIGEEIEDISTNKNDDDKVIKKPMNVPEMMKPLVPVLSPVTH